MEKQVQQAVGGSWITSIRAYKLVYATTQFTALHQWQDAPESVSYLRERHRHIFHVKVTVIVTHGDRAVEFHTLQQHTDTCISSLFFTAIAPEAHSAGVSGKDLCLPTIARSCEDIAELIAAKLSVSYNYMVESVVVSEDGENGGIYRKIYQ